MPIYEFYCAPCHTVFSFLSRRPNTRKRPACPRCAKRGLERRASPFAVSRGRPEPTTDTETDLDEGAMERAMGELARDAEGLDESDPRQMARLMRRLYDSTGLHLGPAMEEAMRRMEAGEDPDAIEEELGQQLEGEAPDLESGRAGALRSLHRRLRPPARDETLYEL